MIVIGSCNQRKVELKFLQIALGLLKGSGGGPSENNISEKGKQERKVRGKRRVRMKERL